MSVWVCCYVTCRMSQPGHVKQFAHSHNGTWPEGWLNLPPEVMQIYCDMRSSGAYCRAVCLLQVYGMLGTFLSAR